jgi:hypothetical protein
MKASLPNNTLIPLLASGLVATSSLPAKADINISSNDMLVPFQETKTLARPQIKQLSSPPLNLVQAVSGNRNQVPITFDELIDHLIKPLESGGKFKNIDDLYDIKKSTINFFNLGQHLRLNKPVYKATGTMNKSGHRFTFDVYKIYKRNEQVTYNFELRNANRSRCSKPNDPEALIRITFGNGKPHKVEKINCASKKTTETTLNDVIWSRRRGKAHQKSAEKLSGNSDFYTKENEKLNKAVKLSLSSLPESIQQKVEQKNSLKVAEKILDCDAGKFDNVQSARQLFEVISEEVDYKYADRDLKKKIEYYTSSKPVELNGLKFMVDWEYTPSYRVDTSKSLYRLRLVDDLNKCPKREATLTSIVDRWDDDKVMINNFHGEYHNYKVTPNNNPYRKKYAPRYFFEKE